MIPREGGRPYFVIGENIHTSRVVKRDGPRMALHARRRAGDPRAAAGGGEGACPCLRRSSRPPTSARAA